METQINIAEILKGCPKGMELDCPMYKNVTLLEVTDCDLYPIRIKTKSGFISELTKFGQNIHNDDAKCVIFPKGKTTWEGFQRPFMDGDVLSYQYKGYKNRTIYIYMQHSKMNTTYYVALSGDSDSRFMINDKEGHALNSYDDSVRLATEEEKAKLFQAIKDNGYKWNHETKTLEKFTPDKFDINTLKPFDKVLMRSSNAREWVATFYSHYSDNKFYGCGMCCDQCIPYEGNEHLRGTPEDCNEYFKTWEE